MNFSCKQHLKTLQVRLILSTDDTKRLCWGEDIALRVVQYFQSLSHTNDRIEQWIEQLVEKVFPNQEKK